MLLNSNTCTQNKSKARLDSKQYIYAYNNTVLSNKSGVNFYFTLFVTDVSDHFFWSEYRVNRTRFHSLGSEFFHSTGVRIE